MYFLMSCGPKKEVFNLKAKLLPKTSLKVKIYMGDGWHLDFKKTNFVKYPSRFLYQVSGCGYTTTRSIIHAASFSHSTILCSGSNSVPQFSQLLLPRTGQPGQPSPSSKQIPMPCMQPQKFSNQNSVVPLSSH